MKKIIYLLYIIALLGIIVPIILMLSIHIHISYFEEKVIITLSFLMMAFAEVLMTVFKKKNKQSAKINVIFIIELIAGIGFYYLISD